jgi:hypothetical protein
VRFSALPPVYRAVPLARGSPSARFSIECFFGNRKVTLYPSGTAALAEAMLDCAGRASARAPEVILPAYGCPDLVAACIHASLYPKLVDIAPSSWSYEPESLKSSLSRNTVAIVAVNLLGIGDDSTHLLALCQERHIPLIQDSAQFLPREPIDWPGEYVILSFGRGKPLNLLHGGALVRPPGSREALNSAPTSYSIRDAALDSRAASIVFNALTRPLFFRLLSALPGTGIGRVAYAPLDNAAPWPARTWDRVATAFDLYRQLPSYRCNIWTSAISEWSNIGISTLHCPGSPLQPEPLRLALLAPDKPARNALVESLSRNGLGASKMYGTDLTAVADVPDAVKGQGPFPNARALADRLFTLPTHAFVTAQAVKSAESVVLGWHQTRR